MLKTAAGSVRNAHILLAVSLLGTTIPSEFFSGACLLTKIYKGSKRAASKNVKLVTKKLKLVVVPKTT